MIERDVAGGKRRIDDTHKVIFEYHFVMWFLIDRDRSLLRQCRQREGKHSKKSSSHWQSPRGRPEPYSKPTEISNLRTPASAPLRPPVFLLFEEAHRNESAE